MDRRRWLAALGVGALVVSGASAGALHDSGWSVAPLAALAQDDDDQDDVGQQLGAPIVGTPLLQPAVDAIEAQTNALTGLNAVAIRSIELTGDDGLLVYRVVLDDDREVTVDATSGAVIATGQRVHDELCECGASLVGVDDAAITNDDGAGDDDGVAVVGGTGGGDDGATLGGADDGGDDDGGGDD